MKIIKEGPSSPLGRTCRGLIDKSREKPLPWWNHRTFSPTGLLPKNPKNTPNEAEKKDKSYVDVALLWTAAPWEITTLEIHHIYGKFHLYFIPLHYISNTFS